MVGSLIHAVVMSGTGLRRWLPCRTVLAVVLATVLAAIRHASLGLNQRRWKHVCLSLGDCYQEQPKAMHVTNEDLATGAVTGLDMHRALEKHVCARPIKIHHGIRCFASAPVLPGSWNSQGR